MCRAMTSLSVSSSTHKPSVLLPSVSPRKTPSKRKKYYVVSVGKCVGVFDNWFDKCVYLLPLLLLNPDRLDVQSMTSGVSGNCHVSFTSYEEALSSYNDLKAKGRVRVVRMYGDEKEFGPLSEAIQ